ncbi:MAG: RDD family protein [Planctomycetota bacterium]
MTDLALLDQVVRTPEGIDLQFRTAGASERLLALVLDLVVIALLLLIVGALGAWVFGPGGLLLWFFLLRQGYFVFCETRGNGTTFGKRRFHLRVIRADGGPLTTEILLARNLTREVELFLPMVLMANPEALFAEHTGVVRIVAVVWVLALMFFPLANRQRMRIGDFLAGTRVVHAPPVELASDLADAAADTRNTRGAKVKATALPEAEPAVPEFVFTATHLAVYGERELVVLEDVLRKSRMPGGDGTVAAVAASIQKRVGFTQVIPEAKRLDFLKAFYTAQRKQLEQQMLLGRRKQAKDARK